MKKNKRSEKLEFMNLDIELADNGIIIRNEANEDEVTLALERDRRNYDEKDSRQDMYKAIGEKVYDWLMDDVINKQSDNLVVTNFDVEISVECIGRER